MAGNLSHQTPSQRSAEPPPQTEVHRKHGASHQHDNERGHRHACNGRYARGALEQRERFRLSHCRCLGKKHGGNLDRGTRYDDTDHPTYCRFFF